jgi:penicillin-binding protein 2
MQLQFRLRQSQKHKSETSQLQTETHQIEETQASKRRAASPDTAAERPPRVRLIISITRRGQTSTSTSRPAAAEAGTRSGITTAAAAENGFDLNAIYQCPPQMEIGTRVFRNYESIGFGPITLQRAMEVSCDTVFYDIANTLWLRDGGLTPIDKPVDAVENMSFAFGLGSKTGIDLPEEVRGRVGGRIFKRNFWDKNHEVWCERAEKGYPEVEAVDPERAKMIQKFAKENCTEGMRFRAGDAVNISIGQGDTVVTPLQMAMAYAAIANGGTVYEPRVVKAIMNADGSVAEKIEPKVKNKLPISNETLKYIQKSLYNMQTI